ncbi:alpha/beta fold hydrolase [Mameliella alba]|uniref:alpha/beta fold hydrolase n=2 Tax=Mameliella alba TaxID=561184 RepID=UPI00143037BA|nr:alpha/beta hydrolase [Mameliella alba]
MTILNRVLHSAALVGGLFAGMASAQDTVSVTGADLRIVDEGDGVPGVFIHGSASDMRVWDDVKDTITQTHRFVAYDRRYFGPGAWPDDGECYNRGFHVDDLIEVIESLDAGPVHLVTWSYGGGIGV